jgi:hypothetical protein
LITGWCLTQLCLLSLASKREGTVVIVGAVGVLFVLFGTADRLPEFWSTVIR